jgi:hypothetical protein
LDVLLVREDGLQGSSHSGDSKREGRIPPFIAQMDTTVADKLFLPSL